MGVGSQNYLVNFHLDKCFLKLWSLLTLIKLPIELQMILWFSIY